MFGRKKTEPSKSSDTAAKNNTITIKGTDIVILQGDITEVDAEVIVNSVDNHFYMGEGIARTIKNKGGKTIEDEVAKMTNHHLGEAFITSGGNLKFKNVIHAITMKFDFTTNEDIIRRAAYNALFLAQDHNVSSIAFPPLGCDSGEFPYDTASKIMAQEIFRYIREFPNRSIKQIKLVLYSDDVFDVFRKNVCLYLQHLTDKMLQGPFLTVDAIIEYNDGVVMIERKNPPFGWALPGGFVNYGESVENAVVREAKEETSLNFINIRQFRVYSDPQRDSRFHTVSVAFIGKGAGELKADSDAKEAAVFKLDSLPEKIAFDHKKIIDDYIEKKTNK